MTTIKKLIHDTCSSIVTMQETKLTHAGLLKLDGYFTYEHIRYKTEGGGVALSALKSLQPAFISDGGDAAVAITVDIHVKSMTITVTSAYGPQESASVEKKHSFWKYLNNEAHQAKSYGKGYILQGDLNAMLGPKLLPGDVHSQNRNGKLFSDFLKENKLTCVNSLPLTEGLITRKRKLLNEVKQSTIDFYVVCERVAPYVQSMKIDNGKHHKLTNFSNTDKEGKAVSSDHYPLTMNVKLESAPVKRKKVEIFNFKDLNSQIVFKEITTKTEEFTKSLEYVHTVSKGAAIWLETVKSHCKKAFKKIRIRTKKIKLSAADKLITERNKLVRHDLTKESNIL